MTLLNLIHIHLHNLALLQRNEQYISLFCGNVSLQVQRVKKQKL